MSRRTPRPPNLPRQYQNPGLTDAEGKPFKLPRSRWRKAQPRPKRRPDVRPDLLTR